jgi:gluconokinase
MSSSIPALVVMGVAGCGKSSVGAAIALASNSRLIEGDLFHPPANIQKMSAGMPLTDDDRAGWLTRLGEELEAVINAGECPILTCSALKRSYRDRLRAAVPGLGFVFLELTPETAAQRVANRPGHFMPASLIDSQFATLEAPHGEDATLTVDATHSLDRLVEITMTWWQAAPSAV